MRVFCNPRPRDDPINEEAGAVPEFYGPVSVWEATGLAPWRLGGFPDDTQDVPTLEFWAWAFGIVQGARADADAHLALMSPDQRRLRSERQAQRAQGIGR